MDEIFEIFEFPANFCSKYLNYVILSRGAPYKLFSVSPHERLACGCIDLHVSGRVVVRVFGNISTVATSRQKNKNQKKKHIVTSLVLVLRRFHASIHIHLKHFLINVLTSFRTF